MIDPAGIASTLTCPALPPPLHLAAGVWRWPAVGWRDRLAALRMAGAIGDIRGGETVRAWLLRHRQTARLIELLWEPLAVAALNQSIDAAAAAPFARVLKDLFGAGARDAALAVPAAPLDELFAQPAKAYIESRGGAVRTNSPATIGCGGGLHGSRVTVRGEPIDAAAVICAVPWHALPDVIEEPSPLLSKILADAKATEPSAIVSVNLWLDRDIAGAGVIGLPGRTMQWLFDRRKLVGDAVSHVSLVSSGASAIVNQSNDELVTLALGELRDAVPRAREATLRRAVVVREKRASFSVAPGQPPRPATTTDVNGLVLAGDWIDTGLPATIEGAALSGHAAADASMHR